MIYIVVSYVVIAALFAWCLARSHPDRTMASVMSAVWPVFVLIVLTVLVVDQLKRNKEES